MTPEQFEQKKREFRKKYKAGYVLPEIINGTLEFKNKRDEFISDLNTLLAEHREMMMEFARWIGFESSRLYYRDLDEKWIMTRFVMCENPTEEYDEYTTDELFEYWIKTVNQ